MAGERICMKVHQSDGCVVGSATSHVVHMHSLLRNKIYFPRV